MTGAEARAVIERVDEAEAEDFEGLTREERYWMRTARDLARWIVGETE
jgi:hypothetical protein